MISSAQLVSVSMAVRTFPLSAKANSVFVVVSARMYSNEQTNVRRP
jgi:hypothetical protein